MALMLDEPGGQIVADQLPESVACAVIFAETLSKLALKGADPDAAGRALRDAGLAVDDFTLADAKQAARLAPLASRNISLADRICLAHALARRLPVLTADRALAGLGLELDVRLIR